jgi:hypothetical protein
MVYIYIPLCVCVCVCACVFVCVCVHTYIYIDVYIYIYIYKVNAEGASEVVVVRSIAPGGPAEGWTLVDDTPKEPEENAPHLEIGDEVLKVNGIRT